MGETVLRALVLAVLLGGCTKRVNQCSSDSDCKDPAYPFCDVNGEYPASGGAKDVCTVTPTDCPVDRCGCTPGATTCNADMLATCNPDGKSQTTTSCALGCASDGSRCLSFDPSNSLGPALAAAAGESDVVLPKGVHIDTDAGTIKNSGGIAIPVQSLVVTQGGSSIRAFYANSFVIDDATITGADAVAFVAAGDITVQGIVDASGSSTSDGPGAQKLPATCAGAKGRSGGAGGGNATAGANGGTFFPNPAAPGGTAEAGFTPLAGGCRGGDLVDSSGNTLAPGGGGGGAIQLVSATAITITGMLDLGAGGGANQAGGGSGGNAVLEAPKLEIDGADAGIVANGGGGGGCGMNGADATRDTMAAAGFGPCSDGGRGQISGGGGGTTSSPPHDGGTASVGGTAGGGVSEHVV